MKSENNEENNVVTIQTKKEVVVKPKVEEFEDVNIEHTIEERMVVNRVSTKIKINWESIAIVFIVVLVLGACAFFVLRFMDQYEETKEKMTQATSTSGLTTTTTTTTGIKYETTTTVQTQATHTIYVRR